METVRIGVIGTGHIGTEHIQRLESKVTGGTVVAVSDIQREACEHILSDRPNVVFYENAFDLIRAADVDAVIITCSNAMHAAYTMEAVKAGKPVFCEKPLGTSAEEIMSLMEAEKASGRHLISVGFMRRFDKGYQAMKREILSREMGEPLIAYCAHRNSGDWKGRLKMHDAQAVLGTAIHEIDVMSWLFDDPFVSAQALIGRSAEYVKDYEDLHDPIVLKMKTRKGIMVLLEVNMSCGYGYDIQCEVVSENGTMKMPEPAVVNKRFRLQRTSEIESTWKTRFKDAFDAEIQAWIDSIRTGKDQNVANAWDAYRAALMADALIEAEKTGEEVCFELPECPEHYRF